MKSIISLIAVLSLMSAQAQTYVGAKGAAMNTWILNKNIFDSGDELDYKGSFAGGFSVAGLHMLGGQSGVALNLGVSNLKQQTQGKADNTEYENESKMKYTDIGVFYTYLSEGGLFIEVGPQFSFRNETITETQNKGDSNEQELSIKDDYVNDMIVYGVFGIGGMINLNEEIKLSLGLRFGYGLNDMTTELSDSQIAELDIDIDRSEFTLYSQGLSIDDTTFELSSDYMSTHPAFASFNLGLYYCFGK